MDIISTATDAVVLGTVGVLLYFQTRGLRREMDRRFDQVDRRFERVEAGLERLRSELLSVALAVRPGPSGEAGAKP
jgi:hypothetical protein